MLPVLHWLFLFYSSLYFVLWCTYYSYYYLNLSLSISVISFVFHILSILNYRHSSSFHIQTKAIILPLFSCTSVVLRFSLSIVFVFLWTHFLLLGTYLISECWILSLIFCSTPYLQFINMLWLFKEIKLLY